MKKKLLWVGDAVCSSGFERATRYTTRALMDEFDVTILGLNYVGDPHNYPCKVYTCWPGGDFSGLGRMQEIVGRVQPDVIVIQQDPWNFPAYLEQIVEGIPVIGAIAVDGKNCRGAMLNGLDLAIFWTEFAREEARLGGHTGKSAVIPLGVDLDIYKPVPDRAALRDEMKMRQVFKLKGLSPDPFIVGVVGRNQPRKRLDLTIEYFAEWVNSREIEDAGLWLHVAPTGDAAYDLKQLAEYYGVMKYVMVPDIDPHYGVTEARLARSYGLFDCLLTTTQGEGFGLPMFEAMACGVPLIVPDWSALGELTKDAAITVPCLTTAATIGSINSIGGIADKDMTVEALDLLYRDRTTREHCRERGLALVAQPKYRWENIGREFTEAVLGVLAEKPEEVTA